MTISSAERKARSAMPLIRFFQTVMPLRLSRPLLTLAVKRVEFDQNIQRESISANGVPCDWLVPDDCREADVLLYLHGGGFVFGQTPQHLQMGAYLALKMKARVLMVDYRLAPEHPYPAALEDCYLAFQWLLGQGVPAEKIVVAGDSAGGNLTLTLLLKLKENGLDLPAAAACMSPVTDLSGKIVERPEIDDPLLPPKALKRYNKSYVGVRDCTDPFISPVYADLHGLPPILVHSGEDEVLQADGKKFVELAQMAGVDAAIEVYPRMWHVWQLNLELPTARQSLNALAEFLGSHMQKE